ncbi:hypothetical protein SELMODRAFT_437402 [Selaginella moellendorffii]|uniref:Uncharacterized protein n=2 Tax=Selaginella moellendorffii TaxID=88036 RepID=D8QQM1_SELML|nr:hypothetical protein SELMODRAFT_437402 [Selaginella moellendorffii]
MDRFVLMTAITIYLSTRSKAVDIFDKGIPRRIVPSFRIVVVSGLATLVNTINLGRHMPRSFSDTVIVNGQECFLRLWFFTAGCDATAGNPDADAMQGFELVRAFHDLHDVVSDALIEWGYSYITAIDGRFGMEYALKEANEELEVAREGAPVIVHGGQACYPYSNMIQSGPKARSYSRLTPGSYLVSRNGLLVLGFDCKELMEGNIVVWRPLISIGANRNCYLRVRVDGRVVFENESVCLWTIDSGVVSGELVSSVLVLQNDRNLVLYRSDEQVAVWASNKGMRGNASREAVMAPAKDYFQALPDALVCRIFGEIGPLHKIAPCRLVCRRWRMLFRGVDYLDFSCADLVKKVKKDAKRVPLLESFIGRTIGATTCGVQDLHITGPEFGVGAVCMWLRAVNSTLECLTLEEDGEGFVQMGNKLLEIFKCQLLKEVSLSYYHIDRVPGEATPLKRLTSFTLNDVCITDEALEGIMELCPVLNYLDICDCTGLGSPYIRHTELTTIFLSFQEALTVFTLSARGEKDPKVEVICVKWVTKLVVKASGVGKIVVRSPCVIGLPRGSSLEKLVLESSEEGEWTLPDVAAAIGGLEKTAIKSVAIPAALNKIEKVAPLKFFGCMANWSGLEIGGDLFKCLRCCRMEELPELPLKRIVIHMPWVDEKSLEVLNNLVRRCALLEKLSICVKDKSKGWKFADGLLKLQRTMKQVEITLSEERDAQSEPSDDKDEENEDERIDEDEEDEDEDDDQDDEDEDDE